VVALRLFKLPCKEVESARHESEEVAALLGVCPRTVSNWLALYRAGGLDLLRRLDYQGDPG
jgi:transposase